MSQQDFDLLIGIMLFISVVCSIVILSFILDTKDQIIYKLDHMIDNEDKKENPWAWPSTNNVLQ